MYVLYLLIYNSFHIWYYNLGGKLKKSHRKVLKKGMKIHMMFHVKLCYLTTYHILLVKLGELPHRITCS